MVALIWGDELAITGKIGDGSFCLDFSYLFFLQEALHGVGSLSKNWNESRTCATYVGTWILS